MKLFGSIRLFYKQRRTFCKHYNAMASPALIVTSKIIELSDCNLETKSLLTGTLLKWMDIAACLSGRQMYSELSQTSKMKSFEKIASC